MDSGERGETTFGVGRGVYCAGDEFFELQLQQDGSETQDVHTRGSPVPTGLTTPPVESPEPPVTVLQPAPSLTPEPHTMDKAKWTLFQPSHSYSVLSVKVCVSVCLVSLSLFVSISLSLPLAFTDGQEYFDHDLPGLHNPSV